MALAAGTRGKPGMVMMSPQIATTNPAPADRRTSRTANTWPSGAPITEGSSVKLNWVLATRPGLAGGVRGVGETQQGFGDCTLNRREALELLRAFSNIHDPEIRRHVLDLVRSLGSTPPT